MLNLAVLAVALIVGILFGYYVRNKRQVNLEKVVFGIILVLIFSLGFSVGSNSELLELLPRVGLNAIVILVLTVFFSVVFVKVAVRLVKLK